MIENASLISLSHQMALENKLTVIANNMANVNTAGYKNDTALFEEYLMPVAQMTGMRGSDKKLSYVFDKGMYRDFSEGGLQQTGNDLDVAISGEGFFVVKTPQGDRYTRNGQFKRDAEGQIVNGDGYPVMGDGGIITLSSRDTQLTIAGDGTISAESGVKGRLRVVKFNTVTHLKKEGDNLLSTSDAPIPIETPKIAQGMIEKSNVKPVLEMTRLIETTRAYVSTAKLVQQAHELRQGAIQALGRGPQ